MPSYRDPKTGRFTTLKRRQRSLARIETRRQRKLSDAQTRAEVLSIENPEIRKVMQRQKLVAQTIRRNQRKRYRDGTQQQEADLLAEWKLSLGVVPDAVEAPYQLTHQGIAFEVSTYRFAGLQEGEALAKTLLRVLRETEPPTTRAWGAVVAGEYDSGDSTDSLTLDFDTLNGLISQLETWRVRPSAGRILTAASQGADVWFLIYVARVKATRKQTPKKRKKPNAKRSTGSYAKKAPRGRKTDSATQRPKRKPVGRSKHDGSKPQRKAPRTRGKKPR